MNIVLGLKDNKNCHKMAEAFSGFLTSSGIEIGEVTPVYKREQFDEAVKYHKFDVGIILEKMDDVAIGIGGIKQWISDNADMRIILVMDTSRRAKAKCKKMYDNGYYNGLFLDDLGKPEMMSLILNDRTDDNAYTYYGLNEYVEDEVFSRKPQNDSSEKTTKDISNLDIHETTEESSKSANMFVSRSFNNNGDTSDEQQEQNTSPKKEHIPEQGIADSVNLTTDNNSGNTDLDSLIEKAEKIVEEVEKPVDDNTTPVIEDVPAEESSDKNTTEKVSEPIVANDNEESLGDLYAEDEVTKDTLSRDENNLPIVNKEIFTSDGTSETKTKAVKNSKTVIYSRRKKKSSFDIWKNIEDPAALDNYISTVTNQQSKELATNQQKGKGKYFEGRSAEIFADCVSEYSYRREVKLNSALEVAGQSDTEGRDSELINDLIDFIENFDDATAEDKTAAFEMFRDDIWKYSVLDDLLDMEDVSEIHVVNWNNIRVKKGNDRHSTNLSFINETHYERFIKNLTKRNLKRYTSNTSMMTVYTDRSYSPEYTLQVYIYKAELMSNGQSELLIRKYSKNKLTLTDMIGGKLNNKSAAVLINSIQMGDGILLCGPSGCGATVLMNGMLEYIPLSQNGIVLQHRDELTINTHPEIIIQHPIVGSDDKPGVTVKELADAALKLDVDYYILGDVIGEEAVNLYKAATQGFITWTSIKATSAEDALAAFVETILSNAPRLPEISVINTILKKFNLIVYMEEKRVVSMSYVTGDITAVTNISDIGKCLQNIPIND